MNVQFTQSSVSPGDELVVNIDSLSTILIESDLALNSEEVDTSQSPDVPLGAVNTPGSYVLHIADGDDNFVSLITVLPADNNQLSIEHDDMTVTPPATPVQPMDQDVLEKFVDGLNSDRLTRAINTAATNDPGRYAIAIGATVAICTVSLALAQPEFCLTSIADDLKEFAASINDLLIEDMVSDGTLTSDEGDHLKRFWGTISLLTDVLTLVDEPEKVEKIISGMNSINDLADLSTDNENVQFGVRSATGLTNKYLVFYKFIQP